MKSKKEWLDALNDMMTRWETLIDSLSEEQIVAQGLPDQWSIKDVMAHLMAWQQVTNARLDAALSGREPAFPDWFTAAVEEVEGQPNETNAQIFNIYHNQPWTAVYRAWQNGFQRVLNSADALSEKDLLEPGVYPWMGSYPLAAVLKGTYEHHEEHLETLQNRLGK